VWGRSLARCSCSGLWPPLPIWQDSLVIPLRYIQRQGPGLAHRYPSLNNKRHSLRRITFKKAPVRRRASSRTESFWGVKEQDELSSRTLLLCHRPRGLVTCSTGMRVSKVLNKCREAEWVFIPGAMKGAVFLPKTYWTRICFWRFHTENSTDVL
jgi:hypothetical protein